MFEEVVLSIKNEKHNLYIFGNGGGLYSPHLPAEHTRNVIDAFFSQYCIIVLIKRVVHIPIFYLIL